MVQAVATVGEDAKIPQRGVREATGFVVLQRFGYVHQLLVIALEVHQLLAHLHDGMQIVLLGRIHQRLFERPDLLLDGLRFAVSSAVIRSRKLYRR